MTLGDFQRLCGDCEMRHGRAARFAWLTAEDRLHLCAEVFGDSDVTVFAVHGGGGVQVEVRVAPPWLQAPYLCFSDLIAERIDEATATGNVERAQNFAIAHGEPEIVTVGPKSDDGGMVATYPTINRRGPGFEFWNAKMSRRIPAEDLEQEMQRAVERVEQICGIPPQFQPPVSTPHGILWDGLDQEAGLAGLVTYYACAADARHRAREACPAALAAPAEEHAPACGYRALLEAP